ncbi:MAG: 50S ribosomal protein L17 [Opitutae bacterium]|nr:50S ribosomal protein L17 [Opitutae bacterium]
MRHRKHNHLLGVKTAHRISLIANLSCSLIENGRITTTLAKARALRPSIEKVITLAKKAHVASDAAQKVHYRRLAIARIRNKKAVKKLFDELVEQFVNRNGGYTRIYKLAMPRLGDAADMAIIEFVEDAPKKKAKKKKTSAKKSAKDSNKSSESKTDQPASEESSEEPVAEEQITEEKPESGSDTETSNDEQSSEDTEPKEAEPEAIAEAEAPPAEEPSEDTGSKEAEPEANPDTEASPDEQSSEDTDSKEEEQAKD